MILSLILMNFKNVDIEVTIALRLLLFTDDVFAELVGIIPSLYFYQAPNLPLCNLLSPDKHRRWVFIPLSHLFCCCAPLAVFQYQRLYIDLAFHTAVSTVFYVLSLFDFFGYFSDLNTITEVTFSMI